MVSEVKRWKVTPSLCFREWGAPFTIRKSASNRRDACSQPGLVNTSPRITSSRETPDRFRASRTPGVVVSSRDLWLCKPRIRARTPDGDNSTC